MLSLCILQRRKPKLETLQNQWMREPEWVPVWFDANFNFSNDSVVPSREKEELSMSY